MAVNGILMSQNKMKNGWIGQLQHPMGCPHNLLNGRGLKVNTAKHSSEKGEGGYHPPFSHHSA